MHTPVHSSYRYVVAVLDHVGSIPGRLSPVPYRDVFIPLVRHGRVPTVLGKIDFFEYPRGGCIKDVASRPTGIVRRMWCANQGRAVAAWTENQLYKMRDSWQIYDWSLRKCLSSGQLPDIVIATQVIEKLLNVRAHDLSARQAQPPKHHRTYHRSLDSHPILPHRSYVALKEHMSWLSEGQLIVILTAVILNEKFHRPDANKEVEQPLAELLKLCEKVLTAEQMQLLHNMCIPT